MINPSKVATLYMSASDEIVNGAVGFGVCRLKAPLDMDRFTLAYRHLILQYPALRARLTFNASTYQFQAFDSSFVVALMKKEMVTMTEQRALSAIYNEPAPLDQVLPLRLRLSNEGHLVIALSHVVANGQSVIMWLDRFMQIYSDQSLPPLDINSASFNDGDKGPIISESRQPATNKGIIKWLGYFSAIRYFLAFFLDTLRNGKKAQTVDLSHAKLPQKGDTHYVCHAFTLSVTDSSTLLRVAKQSGGFLKLICETAVHELFRLQPDKQRVCLSSPADMHQHYPDIDMFTPGNFTGSLIMQVFRGQNAAQKLQSQLAGFRQLLPYWVSCILGATSKDEKTLHDHMHAQTLKPIVQRGPLEDYSIAISNPGIVQNPSLLRYFDEMFAMAKIQTPFLVLNSFKDRITFAFSGDTRLFSAEDMQDFWNGFLSSIDKALRTVQPEG